MVGDCEREIRAGAADGMPVKGRDVRPGLGAVAAAGGERGHPQNTWWASGVGRGAAHGVWRRRAEKGTLWSEEQAEETGKWVRGGGEEEGEGEGEQRRREEEAVVFGFGFWRGCLGRR